MNCKPGDLAVVVGSSKYAGKLVDVLYAAPAHNFRLPCGSAHMGCSPGSWVLRAVGEPFEVHAKDGDDVITDTNRYGVGPDSKLRPIRGDAAPSEVTTDRTIDEGVTA